MCSLYMPVFKLFVPCLIFRFFFFFFNDTATTEIYTLSLHDALPICPASQGCHLPRWTQASWHRRAAGLCGRSEEHTSELQSRLHLVCRLLLEKKKKKVYGARHGQPYDDLCQQLSIDWHDCLIRVADV